MPEVTYRYSKVHEAIGWTFSGLPFVFAVLMRLNTESIDGRSLTALGCMFGFGVLTTLHYRQHGTTLSGETLTLHRFFRRSRTFRWSEIVSARPDGLNIRILASDQTSVLIKADDPAGGAIFDALLKHRPELIGADIG
jgi:hypothetical protein